MHQRITFFLLVAFSQAVPDCGQLGSGFFSNRHKRLLGGEDVKAQDFPWIVRVEVPSTPMWTETCTGTLITDRHLITAGRCFTQNWRNGCGRKPFTEEPYICYLESAPNKNCSEKIPIKKIHLLEEYIASSCHGHFDIVVVELEKPLNSFSKICLPFPNRDVDYEKTNGSKAHILGYSTEWDYIQFGTTQATLIDKFLVSPYDSEKAAICKGDTGGPMFEVHNNTAVLTGVNVMAEGRCEVSVVISGVTGRDPRQYSVEVKQHLERIFNVIASGL